VRQYCRPDKKGKPASSNIGRSVRYLLNKKWPGPNPNGFLNFIFDISFAVAKYSFPPKQQIINPEWNREYNAECSTLFSFFSRGSKMIRWVLSKNQMEKEREERES
jgi:hypothetical protein